MVRQIRWLCLLRSPFPRCCGNGDISPLFNESLAEFRVVVYAVAAAIVVSGRHKTVICLPDLAVELAADGAGAFVVLCLPGFVTDGIVSVHNHAYAFYGDLTQLVPGTSRRCRLSHLISYCGTDAVSEIQWSSPR